MPEETLERFSTLN